MGISSPGLGSSLDVNSIVSQLVAASKTPLTQLNKQTSSLQAKLSAFGTIKSQLASLEDAASDLMSSSTWSARTFSSSNTSALTGTATSSAVATSFSVNVINLAQAQSTHSSAVSTGSAIGMAGQLRITLGSWSGANFSAGSAGEVSVNIEDTDTLSDIASKLNAADAGIVATVVTSGGFDQLVVQSTETGASNGFQIQAFDELGGLLGDDSTALGKLSYASDGNALYGMAWSQDGQDASATIGGITVTSATNTIKDVMSGVTLQLSQTTTAPVTVVIGTDTDSMKTKLQAFVDAYNTLTSNISTLTAYNATTKVAGTLQGDSTAVGIQNTLRRMFGAAGPSGTSFTHLSDIGIEMQSDGTLSIDDTKLSNALTKPEELKTFLGDAGSSTTTSGLARRFYDFAFGANSVSGSVSNRNAALQKAIDRNTDEATKLNDRLTAYQTRLYKQFNALDTKMASLNSLSAYVTQQLAVWSNSSS